MAIFLQYDGNEPATPDSAVRQEVWDIQKSGAPFDTGLLSLEEFLTRDLNSAIDRHEPRWRGWDIHYPGGR